MEILPRANYENLPNPKSFDCSTHRFPTECDVTKLFFGGEGATFLAIKLKKHPGHS